MDNFQLQQLAQRELGAIPLSVGTSLAIESACGVLPEKEVSPPPILAVKELWVNLRTLFRNLMGALDKDFREQVLPDALVMGLQEEMSILESAIVKAGQGQVRVVFYYCSYAALPRTFPRAKKKELSTNRQKVYDILEQRALQILHQQQPSQDVRWFNLELTGQHPAAMIITHCAVDLLNRRHFTNLLLLESHTGAIKPHTQWNTKLTNGKELTRIPFNQLTLQVFGDGGVFFSPMPSKIRSYVIELAEQENWTAVTTREKIIYGIKKLRDPSAIVFLMELI